MIICFQYIWVDIILGGFRVRVKVCDLGCGGHWRMMNIDDVFFPVELE